MMSTGTRALFPLLVMLGMCMATGALCGTAHAGVPTVRQEVTVTIGGGEFFSPPFRITRRSVLEVRIRAAGGEFAGNSQVVGNGADFWSLDAANSTRTLHVWSTDHPVNPGQLYYVRIAGRIVRAVPPRPPRPGPPGPPARLRPNWWVNVPQADIQARGVAEQQEEAPGLVLARNARPIPLTLIAGPRNAPNARVFLDLPPDHNVVNVRVTRVAESGETRVETPTGTTELGPRDTVTIGPALPSNRNRRVGSAKVTLRYQVPNKIMLEDVLTVTVIDNRPRIVPELNFLDIRQPGRHWVYWRGRQVNLPLRDWAVSNIPPGGNPRARITATAAPHPLGGVLVTGVRPSAARDDVRLTGTVRRGLSATDDFSVVRLESIATTEANARVRRSLTSRVPFRLNNLFLAEGDVARLAATNLAGTTYNWSVKPTAPLQGRFNPNNQRRNTTDFTPTARDITPPVVPTLIELGFDGGQPVIRQKAWVVEQAVIRMLMREAGFTGTPDEERAGLIWVGLNRLPLPRLFPLRRGVERTLSNIIAPPQFARWRGRSRSNASDDPTRWEYDRITDVAGRVLSGQSDNTAGSVGFVTPDNADIPIIRRALAARSTVNAKDLGLRQIPAFPGIPALQIVIVNGSRPLRQGRPRTRPFVFFREKRRADDLTVLDLRR